MSQVNPKLIALLFLAIGFVIFLKLTNPYKPYSTQAYWSAASIDDAYAVPQEALEPGNRNGSVLMWAAMASDNPEVLRVLTERGADINEPDAFFTGTPLSAAAGESQYPHMIDALVELGANVHQVVGTNDKTPLIIAAELNENPKIIERLIEHGSDLQYRDKTGRTALEQAKRFNNAPAVQVLGRYRRSL